MKKNNGFAPIAIVLIIIGVLAIGGIAYYTGKNSNTLPKVEENNLPQEEQNDVVNVPVENNQPVVNNNNEVPTPNNEVDVAPTIKVLSPNGGEVIQVGNKYTIKWNTTGFSSSDDVEISLKNDSISCAPFIVGCQDQFFIASTKNTGSYVWDTNLKMSGASTGHNSISVYKGNNFKINTYISSTNNPSLSVSDYSDKVFTINVKKEISTNWKFVDVCSFKLSVPTNWTFTLGGTDSCFVEFLGDGIRIVSDFGHYSSDLNSYISPNYNVTYETIDGYQAKIVTPTIVGSGVTGVYFGNVGNERLTIIGNNLTSSQQTTALQIFHTIEF